METGIKKNSLADFLELTKPRLTIIALLPVVLGYIMGRGSWEPFSLLFKTLLGSALLGAGANALNQYLERDTDAKMHRTENRPLPGNRVGEGLALLFGVLLCTLGIFELLIFVNAPSAFFGSLTVLIYVFFYTPLKKITYLNTYVGAVPGALPCIIGWSASGAALGVRPWILFSILFLWQLPHFFAIAWLYKEDYKRGDLKMLPVCDESGLLTSWKLVLLSLSLLVLSLAPWVVGMAGEIYLVVAMLLGVSFVALSFLMVKKRLSGAKNYVSASIVYLVFLIVFMVGDKKL